MRFNSRFNTEFFDPPQPLLSERSQSRTRARTCVLIAVLVGEVTRVMSLRDAKEKMSKSAPSDMSRINLTDSADNIRLKIQKAKTDSIASVT